MKNTLEEVGRTHAVAVTGIICGIVLSCKVLLSSFVVLANVVEGKTLVPFMPLASCVLCRAALFCAMLAPGMMSVWRGDALYRLKCIPYLIKNVQYQHTVATNCHRRRNTFRTGAAGVVAPLEPEE